MSRRRGRRWASAAAIALVLAVTACAGLGDGGADHEDAEKALLGQRDAVEETAQGLVAASQDVLGGEVLESRGRWEGCTSRFPEGYQDFRYIADVRLQARPGTPEDVGADLRTIAERSGYAVRGSSAGDRVRVDDGAVAADLMDIPDLGAEGDVLIRLAAGPCVAVPQDDWPDWMSRDDPGPDVG
ncbi:hypothetical protein [Nocardioides conyzicola]|uniref:Uncharacterized protein n=1 Tax=Nocardioides conyzicola TaxID=1651781 RepID=A0ABP8WXA3_9ACTN